MWVFFTERTMRWWICTHSRFWCTLLRVWPLLTRMSHRWVLFFFSHSTKHGSQVSSLAVDIHVYTVSLLWIWISIFHCRCFSVSRLLLLVSMNQRVLRCGFEFCLYQVLRPSVRWCWTTWRESSKWRPVFSAKRTKIEPNQSNEAVDILS